MTAGDGTKVKANASMAANATAEQLGLDITGLEKLLEAEVQAWIEQAPAADEAEDALFGDDAPPPGGTRPSLPVSGRRASWPAARRRRRSWRPRPGPGEQAETERAERIAKLAAGKDRLEARAAEELAKGPGQGGPLRRPRRGGGRRDGRRQSGRALAGGTAA